MYFLRLLGKRHGVTALKTALFLVTAVRTANIFVPISDSFLCTQYAVNTPSRAQVKGDWGIDSGFARFR